MNENLNLCEILKDCPKGTKLYSPLFGEMEFVEFVEVKDDIGTLPIRVTTELRSLYFSIDGKRNSEIVCKECMLFPSKEVRTWDEFKVKKPKFDPKTLQPFDRVLAKICDGDAYCWYADFVSMPATVYDRIPCIMSNKDCDMVIPYNEETKHLVGTIEDAPEFYRYWED